MNTNYQHQQPPPGDSHPLYSRPPTVPLIQQALDGLPLSLNLPISAVVNTY